jgi:multidrug efflux system outer membrane protein
MRPRSWLPLLGLAALLPRLQVAQAQEPPTPTPARPRAPAAPSNGDDSDADSHSLPPPPIATMRAHAYSLAECLALADRNFPNLWAARARLAFVHGQLEEAKWTPWFQWSAQSSFGLLPPLNGTVIYPAGTTLFSRNITGLGQLQPFFGFGINGVVPLYTFGKIESSLSAAEAYVRVSEWDMEKAREQMRMDLRRAYFGLGFARDAKYVVDDSLQRLDKAINGVKEKLAKGHTNLTEVDRLRLEYFRLDLTSQALRQPQAETFALAALRFMTGVQTAFDILDEPLKVPDRPLVAVAQYLEAARIFRPEVNMARAGVVARKAWLDYNRAKLFPDLGLGLGADFISTPSAVPQQNLWAADAFNHFYYYFGLGLRWSLDIMPQAARTQQAEAQLEETRALERLALGGAMVEVEKAYADTVEAKSREETWDRAEHLAKQWISIAQDHIDLGTWDENALLEPLRLYGASRINHLQALMDYNVTMSALAQASGWDSAAPSG